VIAPELAFLAPFAVQWEAEVAEANQGALEEWLDMGLHRGHDRKICVGL
jgi:hypothetical protein